ncbi:MAG: dihydroorotase [bacterium]
MKKIIKQGKVFDNISKKGEVCDILIEDGKIIEINNCIEISCNEEINAQGKIVVPGLIDMHTHLREPGREDEETIESGTCAAAKGGFTTVVCMANTMPPIDNQSIVKYILNQARLKGCVNVFIVGAITKGLKGEELAEIEELVRSGVVGISDDGYSIANTKLMYHAMKYVKMFDIPIISHCEDRTLSGSGVMNEGYFSSILGLPGISRMAEEIIIARDIMLARSTKAKLHITHISTKEGVDLIRQAKEKGINVTCDTMPHYFSLTDENVLSFDTNTKVNPPLRTFEDVEAIKQGLADGTIDCIATDHAPHIKAEKELFFEDAPFGMIGLETALPLVITNLVDKNVLSLEDAIKKLTLNPSSILNLNKGKLSKGMDADITIIDMNQEITIDEAFFKSKSKNSPFIGFKLKGKVMKTLVKGNVINI